MVEEERIDNPIQEAYFELLRLRLRHKEKSYPTKGRIPFWLAAVSVRDLMDHMTSEFVETYAEARKTNSFLKKWQSRGDSDDITQEEVEQAIGDLITESLDLGNLAMMLSQRTTLAIEELLLSICGDGGKFRSTLQDSDVMEKVKAWSDQCRKEKDNLWPKFQQLSNVRGPSSEGSSTT